MDYDKNFYYFLGHVLDHACDDECSESNNIHSSTRALYNSLCLRKKFDKHICFVSNITFDGICENGENGHLLKEGILSESLVIEKFNSEFPEGLGMMQKDFASTLALATVKAGDCEGKVKIVCTQSAVEELNKLIGLWQLPLTAISEENAKDEIVLIHQSLIKIQTNKN